MNEEQFKTLTKFTVALTGFIEVWEEQKRAVRELQKVVALICVGFDRQWTANEKELIRDYGEAYWYKKETGTTAEDNASTGQQNLG